MIRPLTKKDREGLIRLLRSTKNFTEDEIFVADELIDVVLNKPDQRDYYARVETAPEADDLTVSGFIVIGPKAATAGTWYLYWLAVDPLYQGMGAAQRLHRWAESFVRARDGYWFITETSSQSSYERARRFYLKQGFCLLAQIHDYYKPSDDLLIYGKRFHDRAPDAGTAQVSTTK